MNAGGTTVVRPAQQQLPGTGDGSSWRIPLAMLALTTIPFIGGTLRIVAVAGGPDLLPANPRVAASPAPLVLHVVAAAVYVLVGAFQFPAGLRRRHHTWHRRAGRVLVPAGLVVALSGVWMTLFYPQAPGGALLWTVRLVAGSAIIASLLLGVVAVRRHDIAAHRAWMIRAYALAVAAGTQVVTQGIGEGVFGVNDWSTGLSVSSGWVINAAIAEWLVRHPRQSRSLPPKAAGDARRPEASREVLIDPGADDSRRSLSLTRRGQ